MTAADVDGFVALYRRHAVEIRALLPLAARDENAVPQMEKILAFDEALNEAAGDRGLARPRDL